MDFDEDEFDHDANGNTINSSSGRFDVQLTTTDDGVEGLATPRHGSTHGSGGDYCQNNNILNHNDNDDVERQQQRQQNEEEEEIVEFAAILASISSLSGDEDSLSQPSVDEFRKIARQHLKSKVGDGANNNNNNNYRGGLKGGLKGGEGPFRAAFASLASRSAATSMMMIGRSSSSAATPPPNNTNNINKKKQNQQQQQYALEGNANHNNKKQVAVEVRGVNQRQDHGMGTAGAGVPLANNHTSDVPPNGGYNNHNPPSSSVPLPQQQVSLVPAPTSTNVYAPSGNPNDDTKFELMNVRLTIYGLSGIVCERNGVEKKKKRFSGGGGKNTSNNKLGPPMTIHGRNSPLLLPQQQKQQPTATSDRYSPATVPNINMSAASTTSSLTSIDYHNHTSSGNNNNTIDPSSFGIPSVVPTTAVISCEKNAVGSQSSVQTYLPSLPIIGPPSSVFNNKATFAASWPLQQVSIMDTSAETAESNKYLSSLEIIRTMQSAGYQATGGNGPNVVGTADGRGAASGTGGNGGVVVTGNTFQTQNVELQIKLSRGTDIFSIGTARVAFSGDEEQETVMHVPVHNLVDKPTKKGPFRKITGKKKKQINSFASDPSLKWSLGENATIKVGIQVIPQKTLDFRNQLETQKKEDELRQLLQQDDLATLLVRIGSNTLGEPIQKNNLPAVREEGVGGRGREPDVEWKATTLAGILCGALPSFCGASDVIPEPAPIPPVVGGTQLISILSSVSESTDGFTEHYPDEE